MFTHLGLSECIFKSIFYSHFGDVENKERLNDLPKAPSKPAGKSLAAPAS